MASIEVQVVVCLGETMFEADQLDKIQRFVEKAIKGKGLLKNRFPDIENWSREALTKRLERILL